MKDIYILEFYEFGFLMDNFEDAEMLSLCSSKTKAIEIAELHAGYQLDFDDDEEISISNGRGASEYWIHQYEIDTPNFDLEPVHD